MTSVATSTTATANFVMGPVRCGVCKHQSALNNWRFDFMAKPARAYQVCSHCGCELKEDTSGEDQD